jgi:hypothetical protein
MPFPKSLISFSFVNMDGAKPTVWGRLGRIDELIGCFDGHPDGFLGIK